MILIMDYSSITYQQPTSRALAITIGVFVAHTARYVAPATLMKNTI